MYLITGSNGQLGTELKSLLTNAIAADVNTLDITDAQAVKDFILKNNVDTIINCAAYTAVDKAEDEENLATKINVDGPRNLAQSGAKRVIHISTDYVFDGTAHVPLTPYDKTNPVSVYGRTKLLGEKAVYDNAPQAYIIRTSWLYSPYGNNFVKTMLKLGHEKRSINVVSDQIGTPTYAHDLALAIVALIDKTNDKTFAQKKIYHFSNEGVCSWYDFAANIMKFSNLDCKVNAIPSSSYPTKALRPFYSVLDKSDIKKDLGIEIPNWQDSLENCIQLLIKQ